MAGKELIAQGEERRQHILAFIRNYLTAHGWAPTIAEIAEAVGLVSPNSTRRHLLKLQEAGYLKIGPGIARALVPVTPAPDGWVRGQETPQEVPSSSD